MKFKFVKYQGAGNDFIIIEDQAALFPHQNFELIKRMCHRHFGIGADGFMLLRNSTQANFKMLYYNADGNPSSLCGNGSRCIADFAYQLGLMPAKGNFEAFDGIHTAEVNKEGVEISMDVSSMPQFHEAGWVLHTGSPHLLRIVEDTAAIRVTEEGRFWRNHPAFVHDGINVNFVEFHPHEIKIRTYERGVEDETLAGGTGITAAAILGHFLRHREQKTFDIQVKAVGGACRVKLSFDTEKEQYTRVLLFGPAMKVFEGTFEVPDFGVV